LSHSCPPQPPTTDLSLFILTSFFFQRQVTCSGWISPNPRKKLGSNSSNTVGPTKEIAGSWNVRCRVRDIFEIS
jgi:hypothetical protein